MTGHKPYKLNLASISSSGSITFSGTPSDAVKRLKKRIASTRAAKAKEEKPAPKCPLCNEDVDTDYHTAERKPAYLDGWHHWDCLDEYLGVKRNPDGSRVE